MAGIETKSSEQNTLSKILEIQKDALAKGDRLKADQIQKKLEEFGIKDIQKTIESGLKKLTSEQEFALKQIIEKDHYEKGESIYYFAAREGYKKISNNNFDSKLHVIPSCVDIYEKNGKPDEILVLIKDAKIITRSYILPLGASANQIWIAEYEDINGNMSSIELSLRDNLASVKAFNH